MKLKTLLKITTLILASVAGSVASANNAITEIQTSTMQAPGAKRLTIMSGLEYSQATAAEEQGTRASNTDFLLSVGYKTSDLTTLTAKAIASKDHTGPQDTTVSNTQIILGIKGIKLNDQVTSVHSVIGVVPTSDVSKRRDRLQTALGISNGVIYVAPALTATFRLAINKNFHEFNFNADGKANVQYTLTNTVGVDIPVYGSFHVSSDLFYRNGWTYGGSERQSFGFNADLIYDIDNNFSVNLGTSNDGNALKANGVDSNIAAYDDKTSVFRAGLSYVY